MPQSLADWSHTCIAHPLLQVLEHGDDVTSWGSGPVTAAQHATALAQPGVLARHPPSGGFVAGMQDGFETMDELYERTAGDTTARVGPPTTPLNSSAVAAYDAVDGTPSPVPQPLVARWSYGALLPVSHLAQLAHGTPSICLFVSRSVGRSVGRSVRGCVCDRCASTR